MQRVALANILQKKFIGVDDFRRELTEILDEMSGKSDRLVITQHGKPKAILLDLTTYLELTDIQEDVIQPGYIDSLYKELEKVKGGKGLSHERLVKKLKL